MTSVETKATAPRLPARNVSACPRCVLIIMPLAEQRGGGELMLWNLLERGRCSGINWIIVFLENGPMVEAVSGLGIEVIVVTAGRLRQPFRYIRSVLAIARIARERKADMIFSWMTKPHLYGGPAAIISRAPAAWYQLGLPAGNAPLDRIATAIPARGVVACSVAGAHAQRKLWPHRKVNVVHPGVELSRFDPALLPSAKECREKLNLPSVGPLVGIVGRLQRWKGIHVLIEAMPIIKGTYPEVHCVVVGGKHDLEPEYPDYLRDVVSRLRIEDTVTFAGLRTNVPEWMQAMDVIVHASDREPFGIVVIEAMSLGKPVVASDTGGPTEVITPAVDGLLAPFGDATALAGSILRYLAEPEFAQEVGRAARKRAAEFSTARYASALIHAIDELLKA